MLYNKGLWIARIRIESNWIIVDSRNSKSNNFQLSIVNFWMLILFSSFMYVSFLHISIVYDQSLYQNVPIFVDAHAVIYISLYIVDYH